MPETLPGHVPSPRTPLAWDGTRYRPIHIDALGNVQIDVVASVLPAGAATAAHQVTQTAALERVDDLQGALQAVALARLLVRGMDQLFTLKGVLSAGRVAAISGAGGFLDSQTVPAGEYWIVTTISVADNTTPTTHHYVDNRHDGVNVRIYDELRAIGAAERTQWGGHVYLDPGDTVRAWFVGGLGGDSCVVDLNGYRMTLET